MILQGLHFLRSPRLSLLSQRTQTISRSQWICSDQKVPQPIFCLRVEHETSTKDQLSKWWVVMIGCRVGLSRMEGSFKKMLGSRFQMQPQENSRRVKEECSYQIRYRKKELCRCIKRARFPLDHRTFRRTLDGSGENISKTHQSTGSINPIVNRDSCGWCRAPIKDEH